MTLATELDPAAERLGPYLLFLGDATEPAYAKTAFGVRDWARDRCVGQFSLPSATVDTGLPYLEPGDANALGARALLIGVATPGGPIPPHWMPTLKRALAAGLDIVSGMHVKLNDIPELCDAARELGRKLIDLRVPPKNIAVGSGKRRGGRRLLTVGTDCALGKKYTALAVAKGLRARGIEAEFRATGQTGIMIAGAGIPIDAVVADFISGAAEMLSPAASPQHLDVIEGQGSLFHPAYAAVSLGLLHGSQPDMFIVCHQPGRSHVLGYPDFQLPAIEEVISQTIALGRLTNPAIRCVGISLNTAHLSGEDALQLIGSETDRLGLPVADPMRPGPRSKACSMPARTDRLTGSEPLPSRFQRFILPGLAFKAVVIGGGYATGRELAEFFLARGPWGGLFAILFATLLFSVFCALTFVLARRFGTFDYRSLFKQLLGPAWLLFELSYLIFVVLILAVYGAAAGAIGDAVFGAPLWIGTLLLGAGIAGIVAFGNKAVERLFRDVSYYLYAVYALFIVLALWKFGTRVPGAFAIHSQSSAWVLSGATYFGYNIIGAAVILPVLRHLTSDRDAIIAGVISGPLAMLPALLFFVPMVAFYPEVQSATLPSAFLLGRIGIAPFELLFQAMIFLALLESGTSSVHAINERIGHAWLARSGTDLTNGQRLGIALVVLVGCMFLASRFGLVALIATGYRALSYMLLATFILPLLTVGLWKLRRGTLREPADPQPSPVRE